MAINDRIPTELCLSALTASAVTYFTNGGASYRTQVLQALLCNTGASSRVITLYKNGTATTNQIMSSITLPAGTSTVIDLKLVCTGTQTIGAKQDAGTDVNMCLCGIVEQIA